MLYLNKINKSVSQIGAITDGSVDTTIIIPKNTDTQIGTLTITKKGTYILISRIQLNQGSTNGHLQLIMTTANGTGLGTIRGFTEAGGGLININAVVVSTPPETFKLYTYHNIDSSNVKILVPMFKAIKLA